MLSPHSVSFLIHPQRGEQVFVIDAGDGTIDISAYTVLNNRPLQVEELFEPKRELDKPSQYVFRSIRFVPGLLQGGEFVTARARAMVQGTF